jgi:ferritin-like protein
MGIVNQATSMVANQKTDSFGSTSIANLGTSVADAAASAHARAMVESRYVMAMRQPRNMDQVRQDLIAECRRPSFANNPSAFYRKPIGQGVEGLGIRFVEVALRCMKNVVIETKMVYENDLVEVHNVAVTDLEANVTYPMDVKVTKTVERSKPDSDGSYISVRMNSYNKPVYTVPAQDDDLLNKRGALISKAIRTLGLRIIPGDLQDEAEDIIKEIRKNQAAADPDAERKKIVDAFAGLGVKASDLVAYLGHDLGQCSPAQLNDLRGIFGALREGEATWKSVMANKADQEAAAPAEAQAEKPSKSATAKAKEKAAESIQEAAASKPAETSKPDPDFVGEMERSESGGFDLE